MWKFLAGMVAGTVLAVLYVLFNVQLPGFLQIPALVRGGVISTSTEAILYELRKDSAERLRALEVYFDNRAGDAAELDASAGHPFLKALHRARAVREARILSARWEAFDQALAQPALRQSLESRHGTIEPTALKQAMLWEAMDEAAFLREWIAITYGQQSPQTLYATLLEIRQSPSEPTSP